MRTTRDDTGGIITGWLMQMIVFIAILGLILYEVGSVGITAVSMDDTARDVASAAALNYRETKDLAEATEAGTVRAQSLEVEITEDLVVDEGDIVVTISKQAPTLIIHKIGFLEDLTRPSVTGRAPWVPR
ncbi:MAG TPA: hypothetical protein VGA69_00775 [Nitriliruptorales bacterium]